MYDRLISECPGYTDRIREFPDGVNLRYTSFSDCSIKSTIEDRVGLQKGFEAVIKKHVVPGEWLAMLEFGSQFIVEPPPKPPVYKPPWWETPEVIH